MMCALIGSSTWLTIATSLGLPLSTTHCIVGGVIGMGVASLGVDGVVWGWEGKGVAQILASWVVAPAIAAAFASIIFLITKYGVLRRSQPLKWGFVMVPVYFAITSGILTMLIVWKGAASLGGLKSWSDGQIVGCILGVSGGVALLVVVFFLPFLHRKLIQEDWTLRWYHIFQGPLLLRRGSIPEAPEGVQVQIVQDYYRGKATREDLEAANIKSSTIADVEAVRADSNSDGLAIQKETGVSTKTLEDVERADTGAWHVPKNLWKLLVDAFLHGVRIDVISEQGRASKLSKNINDMHARAHRFDNRTEHLYSFLQILTAATASFAHGANDVSNATGPLATIYLVWQTGIVDKKSPVPLWVLAYGGASIVIGLWTYGYNIMRNLGNRLTLQSPSRGFSIELGSAVTVLLATRLSLPISTTQCIIGATMGVALCNGDYKALNWRMVAWCYAGWILTLPVAGTISGCFMGIIINAPRW
ncbi:phosphate transporter [Choiromyces venosus 120613-1]|uniref:Phosphate transporter n=1 Tax=Choiromyces venosus 120613-1 TaxID=1336337 RepID=A0A3N4JA10_9PEZI|nr:phosphate transporter [Choiromyces venosus 120613-1]